MSTYGIPDDEIGQQRAEAEQGEAFAAIPTPMTDKCWEDMIAQGPKALLTTEYDFARYLERRLAVVTKERDQARRHVSDLCLPLHDFVQTCGLFDGTDAGRDVAKTSVKYANQFKKDRDRYKSALKDVQKFLQTPNPAIVDTIWIRPGETLLDCVEYALGGDQ